MFALFDTYDRLIHAHLNACFQHDTCLTAACKFRVGSEEKLALSWVIIRCEGGFFKASSSPHTYSLFAVPVGWPCTKQCTLKPESCSQLLHQSAAQLVMQAKGKYYFRTCGEDGRKQSEKKKPEKLCR